MKHPHLYQSKKALLRNLDIELQRARAWNKESLKTLIHPQIAEKEVLERILEKDQNPRWHQMVAAFLDLYPEFIPPPEFQLYLEIYKDRDDLLLDNEALFNRFNALSLEKTPKILRKCYKIAFLLKHPYLVPEASSSVLPGPRQYNLNFLWVNCNPQNRTADKAINIFGLGFDELENDESLINPENLRKLEADPQAYSSLTNLRNTKAYKVAKWAEKNHRNINVWYDSALVTQVAVDNTFAMLSKLGKARGAKICLKDVRALPYFANRIIQLASRPDTNVYFRVDLYKVLIAQHFMEKKEVDMSVISDWDIHCVTPQQLFDQTTMEYLLNPAIGYVANYAGICKFENSFQIYNNNCSPIYEKNTKIIEAVKKQIENEETLHGQSVFALYTDYIERAENGLGFPRKVGKCPDSQFERPLSDDSFLKERFRFMKNDELPCVEYGRGGKRYSPKPILEFKDWKAECVSPNHQACSLSYNSSSSSRSPIDRDQPLLSGKSDFMDTEDYDKIPQLRKKDLESFPRLSQPLSSIRLVSVSSSSSSRSPAIETNLESSAIAPRSSFSS